VTLVSGFVFHSIPFLVLSSHGPNGHPRVDRASPTAPYTPMPTVTSVTSRDPISRAETSGVRLGRRRRGPRVAPPAPCDVTLLTAEDPETVTLRIVWPTKRRAPIGAGLLAVGGGPARLWIPVDVAARRRLVTTTRALRDRGPCRDRAPPRRADRQAFRLMLTSVGLASMSKTAEYFAPPAISASTCSSSHSASTSNSMSTLLNPFRTSGSTPG
jgi:hypothetical protein